MLQINDEKKTDILISSLQERYTAIHNIRERVQSVSIWVLGILLATGGWFIQSQITLLLSQKILAIAGISVAFIVLRFKYFRDLRNGFENQQMAAVNIEKTLGLFTPEYFKQETADSILPQSWKNSGSPNSDGNFFDSLFMLLYVGVGFTILSILFSENSTICFYNHFWRW